MTSVTRKLGQGGKRGKLLEEGAGSVSLFSRVLGSKFTDERNLPCSL